MKESIRRVNGYDNAAYTYYPVLIIGAGEAGIAMGCQLKQRMGFDQFRIFDRQAGIGGTWWINRYPGVACDVPAMFYSYSFAQNPKWTELFPPGPEIVQYLHEVCEKFQITDKIECNTDVDGCRWLEDEKLWEVTLRRLVHGVGDLSANDRRKLQEEKGDQAVFTSIEVVRARVVISGVGGLVEPKEWPKDIPGRDEFEGPVFHSARWDYSVDMKDKDVVVIGSGCSAAQFVPKLTKAPFNARSVTQLMRTPPWVVLRLQPPGSEETWKEWSPWLFSNVPGLLQLVRTLIFVGAETDFRFFGASEYAAKERKKYEAMLLRQMKKRVPAKYHDIMTPDYSVCCKRRIFDQHWLPGLADPKIELTTQPLASLHARSVTIGPGATYKGPDPSTYKGPTELRELPADVVVLANGFNTTRWLHPLKVTGVGGKDLIGTMEERGGAQAYLGTAMDGFPNFFMIFGPNTATGHSSVVMAIENMVNYAMFFVAPILRGEVDVVDVKREAEVAYTTELQAQLKKTVFQQGGCSSWYYMDNGWNPTVYPRTQIDFAIRCMFPKYNHWNISYTRKGLTKRFLTRTIRSVLAVLLVVGAWRARKAGLRVADVPQLARTAVARVLEAGVRLLQAARGAV